MALMESGIAGIGKPYPEKSAEELFTNEFALMEE
jgi:hypothetical protein